MFVSVEFVQEELEEFEGMLISASLAEHVDF